MVVRLENLPPHQPPLRTDDHGVVRIGGTRVTLDTVWGAFESGSAPEEIVLRYPSLQLAQVYAVISHCLAHADEVAAYLNARRHVAAAVREQNEQRFPPDGVRARLLARRRNPT